MDRRNLLFKVGKDENDVTEVLCNLMRDKYVRDILLDKLGIPNKIYKDIIASDIQTQISIEQGKRPDIIIQNNDVLIFIENKIKDSPLYEAQYTTYIDEIKNSYKKYRFMIYLIPMDYKYEYLLTDTRKKNKDICIITYWENFLDEILKYEIEKSNIIFNEGINFISSRIREDEIKTSFNLKEIIIMCNTQDLIASYGFFHKFGKIIEKADELIFDKLNKIKKNTFKQSNLQWDWNVGEESEKGKYLNFNDDDDCIYYGINYNIANDNPANIDFFISLAIKIETIKDEKRLLKYKKNGTVVFDNEWAYFKLNKYIFAEENCSDIFANNVVEIINSVLL